VYVFYHHIKDYGIFEQRPAYAFIIYMSLYFYNAFVDNVLLFGHLKETKKR